MEIREASVEPRLLGFPEIRKIRAAVLGKEAGRCARIGITAVDSFDARRLYVYDASAAFVSEQL